MNKYVVYKHTSPSGKCYIGITQQEPDKRWKNGLGYQDNPYFFNAIQKYGWKKFSHEILFEALSKEEAERTEADLIKRYDSTNRDKGYNIASGGSAPSPSEETKAKTSESLKAAWQDPEKRARIVAGMANAKRSEKSRQNISRAQKERFKDPEERRRISERQRGSKRTQEAKTKTSESLKAFYSIPENKEAYKKAHEGINRKNRARPVICIDTNERFDAVIDASLKYGVERRNIIAVCKGKRKQAGGHFWQYA